MVRVTPIYRVITTTMVQNNSSGFNHCISLVGQINNETNGTATTGNCRLPCYREVVRQTIWVSEEKQTRKTLGLSIAGWEFILIKLLRTDRQDDKVVPRDLTYCPICWLGSVSKNVFRWGRGTRSQWLKTVWTLTDTNWSICNTPTTYVPYGLI